MPKVSVIIPVYNAEAYLRRCLDSVCRQTLKDIEVICVDDCSTDNSLEILKEYAQKYPQMKVIHHEFNGGESRARNTGLDNATGEYLGFVDNDDEIDLDFYEKLYHEAIEYNADIVKANVKTVSYDGSIEESKLNPIITVSKNKWHFHYEWWSAIYKGNLIKENNIKLLENYVLGGDSLFLNEAIINCRNFHCINDTYYMYYRRTDSGDSLKLSEMKVLSSLSIFERIFNNVNCCYVNKEIDVNAYLYLCENYIDLAFCYIFRTDSLTAKSKCCSYVVDSLVQSLERDKVLEYILSKYASVYKFVDLADKMALMAFIKEKTKKDFYKANVLSKLRYGSIQRGKHD